MTDQTNPVDTPADEPAITVTSPEWPRDIYGITSGLRREIARTVGRLNGDPQKLEVFMKTLQAGAKWGKERIVIQQGIKKASMEDADDQHKIELEKRKLDDAKAGRIETDEERATRQANAGIKGAVVSKG